MDTVLRSGQIAPGLPNCQLVVLGTVYSRVFQLAEMLGWPMLPPLWLAPIPPFISDLDLDAIALTVSPNGDASRLFIGMGHQ
jgi:hypothetical protein